MLNIRIDSEQYLLIESNQTYDVTLNKELHISDYEDRLLFEEVINPIENFETVRFIHKSYLYNIETQDYVINDLHVRFIFKNGSSYLNGLNYELAGLPNSNNITISTQNNSSFFRLEFYKALNNEPISFLNKILLFANKIPVAKGEKYFNTTYKKDIYVPVFYGDNYKNKDFLYFYLKQTNQIMQDIYLTARFFNTFTGEVYRFKNKPDDLINENLDLFYKLSYNQNNEFEILDFNDVRVGTKNNPLVFYSLT